ncbi:MAG: HEAT repeat domain-containing protein [Candidatus Omnitrophica bacterium]|nr:HEAT repeat domain-containing protein [Candidatus Omnitrophota bacterium]
MILIDVRKEERGKVFLIWAMSALLATGYVIGWAAVNAMLVKRLGVDYLPYIYIGISLLGVAGSSIYLMFADTVRRDKLLILFSAVTGVVLLMSRFFVSARHEGGTTFSLSLIMFFVLVLFAQGVGNSMLGTQVWTIANDVFRPSQGKRLYPIIGTAGIVGGILGGLFIQTLVSKIGTANLIVVWSAAILLIIPLTMIFRKRYGGELSGMKGPSGGGMTKNEGRIKNLKECYEFFISSPLMKILVAVAALFWIVGSFQDFQYTRIMNATFTTEETLSKFYGYYAIGFNIVAIFIQAFLTGRILGRIGVGRGLSVLPLTVLAGFATSRGDNNRPAVPVARNSRPSPGASLMFTMWLALNAVPGRLRARVRGVIDGVVNPIGGILGGIVILILRNTVHTKAGSPFDIITIIGLVLSGLWLFLTLGGQKKYVRAIVDNLKDKDRQTFMDAVESLDERGSPMVIQKLLVIVQTEDKAARLAALRTLTRLGHLPALRVITQLMSDPDEEIRAASIQTVRKFTKIEQDHFLSFYFKRRMERFMTEDKSSMVRSEAARYLIERQPVRDMPYFVHISLSTNLSGICRILFMTCLATLIPRCAAR